MSADVAVVGATGAVGEALLAVLAERNFPIRHLRLLASGRSAGRRLTCGGESYTVEELSGESFHGVDIALFSAGSTISKEFAPTAVKAGAIVVDNSSAFRMDPEVPLVVPEVNPQMVKHHQGIVANPNCSTIIMNVPVWALHRVNPITRIVVSTYQAVSGAGAAGLEELDRQTKAYGAGQPIEKVKFRHQIVNNLFSHDTAIADNGYNEEEMKMLNETRKIFGLPGLSITATCIRVPIARAHCESINLEFSEPITAAEAKAVLAQAPGVAVVDDPDNNHFPMPVEASHQDNILVGRIRQDMSREDGRGIEVFVAGDQIRKGAATNAVQIAELLQ